VTCRARELSDGPEGKLDHSLLKAPDVPPGGGGADEEKEKVEDGGGGDGGDDGEEKRRGFAALRLLDLDTVCVP
jgi:hypothetical protein